MRKDALKFVPIHWRFLEANLGMSDVTGKTRNKGNINGRHLGTANMNALLWS